MKKNYAKKSKAENKIVGQNTFLSRYCLWAIFCLLSLTSCYQNVEGCLDIQATNFDLDADIDCDGCCIYPKLKVSFLHRVKDDIRDTFYNFSLNTPYNFTGGDTFQVSSIQFYLSDFKLKLEDGTLLGVEDTVNIFVPNTIGSIRGIEDNFVLVDRSRPTSSDVGTIRGALVCTGMEFKLGIKDSANVADPTYFEATHPLYSELDGDLYFSQDSGYVFNRIDLFRSLSDTLGVSILMGTSDFLQPIVVDFPFFTKIGFNTTVILRVDYRAWLKEIDFANDSAETMAEKISNGIAESFEVTDVRKE